MSEVSISVATLPILVIDVDRTFHAIVLAAASSLPGAHVTSCTSPGEALNRLDGFTPAMIVIEGRLSGAAGLNFVRRLRAGQTPAPADTLVMFVSQDFSGGLSGKLCEVGCHAVVRKPLSPEALARAIMRVFENPTPFVMGGNYLGPDRRKPNATEKRDPDRRRTVTRGGWGAAPRRTGSSAPLVAMTISSGPKATAKSGAIETAEPIGGAVRSESAYIETAALPAGKSTPARGPIETAETQKPARTPIEPLAPAPPAKRVRAEPIEAPDALSEVSAKPKEDYDLAPPAQEKSKAAKEPEFDVAAVVELHRQWIMSNGKAGARAILAGKPLIGAGLSGVNLAKADFRGADLTSADLRNSILVDADLRNSSLAQAALNEAQLAGAKIRHADLQFAQMPLCGLQGSDLAGADLRGASLTGADLSGANLLGTDLRGTDMTSGLNLTQKQLDRAKGDHTTQLPPGLFVSMDEAVDK